MARVIFWLAVVFLIFSVLPDLGGSAAALTGGIRQAAASLSDAAGLDLARARVALLEGRIY